MHCKLRILAYFMGSRRTLIGLVFVVGSDGFDYRSLGNLKVAACQSEVRMFQERSSVLQFKICAPFASLRGTSVVFLWPFHVVNFAQFLWLALHRLSTREGTYAGGMAIAVLLTFARHHTTTAGGTSATYPFCRGNGERFLSASAS